jgi:ABC-type nitrate/sulfonate/bicarbonate transport system substrate-binding protein
MEKKQEGSKMRKLLAFIAAGFFFSLIGAALAADKIRVAYVSLSPSWAPVWIAKETGIFARHGLGADVILLTGSPRLVQSLIAGDVDYGLAGATAMARARIRGADVVILATASNLSNMKLLVGGNSAIRRIEELKGRVIGVSQYGSDADVFARIVVEKAGLKPDKDVAILQLGGHPQVAAALAAGKIESGILGGLASLTAQKSGAMIVTSGTDLKVAAMSGTVATTRGRTQRQRDSVARFMRAYGEAFHYFKTNREGAVPILQKYMGGITTEQARFLHDEYVEVFEELPIPSERILYGMLQREGDPKAKAFKPADLIDLSFVKELYGAASVEKVLRR